MTEKPSRQIQLLRRHKPKLITILSGQADFVLQHADSHSLVTPQGYRQIKACRTPDEKVRDLLDHIIERGPEAAQGLLELFKDQELQETFPLLDFIKSKQIDTWPSENQSKRKKSRNRKRKAELQEVLPPKKNFSNSSKLVTEKQLMTLARAVGRSWREIAILALDISSVKLEQIVADNPLHVDQVFAMLRYWRNCKGEEATAAHLYSLLSRPDLALPPESFAFLSK